MSSVSVLCRLKPASEDDENDFIVVDGDHKNTLVVDPNRRDNKDNELMQFSFDHVIPSDASQSDVFVVVKPIVEDALLGYNSTVFTYGQTGSGKTYTMHGGSADVHNSHGVVPRSMEVVFENVQREEEAGKSRIVLAMSCLEIYQEKLFDLLHDEKASLGNSNRHLRIRQRQSGEVWVEGLSEKPVCNMAMFEELFSLASKRRAIGSHSMNRESSRSHFCCIVSIEKSSIPAGEKITSKIHLIDLAGSEMVRKTSAGGARLNEAKYINKSLSALGNVINSLTGSGSSSASAHIPYRDSKLTRLLQDSLSGNSKTILILTLSLSSCHLHESIATLRFGERARKLKTIPKINSESTEASSKKQLLRAEKQLVVLNATIAELRGELIKKDNIINDLKKSQTVENCSHCRLLKEENEKLTCALKTENVSRPLEAKPAKSGKKTRFKASSMNNGKQVYVDQMTPEEIQKRFDVPKVVTSDGDDTNAKADEESRCGVCRLNESETEQLLRDTGEALGEYFTCDGNCGNKFHVRCAGEVDESGSYQVPSGEWYCTSCAVEDDDSVMKAPPVSSPSKLTSEDASGDDIDAPSLQNRGMSIPTSISNEAQVQQAMARLQAEYHAMRRERNRVLNQWQHEKRLQAVSEKYREETERDRDEELVTAKEVILKLQSDVLKAQQENNRLKAINDDIISNLEKEKQRSETDESNSRRKSKPSDTNDNEKHERKKPSVDSELRKKITSDTLQSKSNHSQDKKNSGDRVNEKRPESALRTSPIGRNDTESVNIVEETTSRFQIKSMPKLIRKSKKSAPTVSSHSYSGSEHDAPSSIPKPWIQRAQSETESSGLARKLSTSPIRSRKENSNSAGADGSDNRDSAGRRQRLRNQQSPSKPRSADNSNDSIEVSVESSQGSTEMSTSLKSPLIQTRLRSLLASVQEEAGIYQEIKKKHKVRSDEREMLKSRSGGRGYHAPLPSLQA